jgi:hypothetical protein
MSHPDDVFVAFDPEREAAHAPREHVQVEARKWR